jgi:hypothetical protein
MMFFSDALLASNDPLLESRKNIGALVRRKASPDEWSMRSDQALSYTTIGPCCMNHASKIRCACAPAGRWTRAHLNLSIGTPLSKSSIVAVLCRLTK